jgi:cytochrome c oxidase subunit 1
MLGDHRRIFSYEHFPDQSSAAMQNLRIFATSMLILMIVSQIPFFINFFYSMFYGKKAGANPWQANTLEWVAPSPPPHGNFAELPNVYRGPYEFSVPGRASDFWPQNEKA